MTIAPDHRETTLQRLGMAKGLTRAVQPLQPVPQPGNPLRGQRIQPQRQARKPLPLL